MISEDSGGSRTGEWGDSITCTSLWPSTSTSCRARIDHSHGQHAVSEGAEHSVPKLQSCLGVGVENSGPKKAMRVENLEENMA